MDNETALALYPLIYGMALRDDWLGTRFADSGHRYDIRELLTHAFPGWQWRSGYDAVGRECTRVYHNGELIGEACTPITPSEQGECACSTAV